MLGRTVAVQDTQNTVNVALRIRPVANESSDFIELRDGSVTVHEDKGGHQHKFNFHMATSRLSNEQFYNQVAAPVVDGALDGFNATILAYGQTGSGASTDQHTGTQSQARHPRVSDRSRPWPVRWC